MDEKQRQELAWSATDQHTLAELAQDESESVRCHVASNRSTGSTTLEALASDESQAVRGCVAANPHATAAILTGLAADKDNWVRSCVARNHSCPASLLEALALDTYDYTRSSVAGNPEAPVGLLDHLAMDPAPHVRIAVARHPETSAATLASLAHDEDGAVREAVARHPQIPVEVLVTLAADSWWQVRAAVAESAAKRSDCPLSLITQLANDRTKSVRLAIAQKPDLPAEVVQNLADQGFLSTASLQSGLPSDLTSIETIRSIKSATQRAELLRQSTDPDVLASFAADESTTVRCAVIENPHASDAAISTVLKRCQGNVWTGVNATIVRTAIGHPNSSEETLLQAASLANGTNLTVLLDREPPISFDTYVAVIALDVGSTYLQAAARSLKRRCVTFTEEQWQQAATYDGKQARLLVAMNDQTPADLLTQLAMDPEPSVRKAVMKNKKAPETARASAALLDGS